MDNNAIEFSLKYTPRRLRNGKLLPKTVGLLQCSKKIHKVREDQPDEKKAKRLHARNAKLAGNWSSLKPSLHDAIRRK